MTEPIKPNKNDLRGAIINAITDVWDRAKQVDWAADEVIDLIEADRQARGGDQRAAFEAWYMQHNKLVPTCPAKWVFTTFMDSREYADKNVKIAYEAWQAALESPEVRVTQYMAECMTMVRDELIEAGIIGKEVASMFLADAVLRYVVKLRNALEQYADPNNWDKDEFGRRRIWREPGSTTPEAYDGYELALAALAAMEKRK